MAVVTSDFLNALYTNYRAVFQQALGDNAALSDEWKKIATVINSDTDKESYNWLGATPSMQEWKDVRSYLGLRNWDYTLTNRHYEGTIEVSRDTLEDDKYDMIMPRIRGLARSALKHYLEMVFSQLDDGETLTAYDGTAMFADTRVIGDSANIDNLMEGDYSDSATEIRAGIRAAVEQMRLFQDDWGRPLNLMPDTVVCAPGMEIAVKDALLPGVAGTRRPEMDYIKDIIVSPWIDADNDDWFLLCTTEEIKPLIFQLRKEPQFLAVTDLNDSEVFKTNHFLFGVDDRFTVGFGDPRTAIIMHNT